MSSSIGIFSSLTGPWGARSEYAANIELEIGELDAIAHRLRIIGRVPGSENRRKK
jgi:hypothetical protein